MNPKTLTDLSKFLSFVLRHEPEAIGLDLGPNGWVEIEHLPYRPDARSPRRNNRHPFEKIGRQAITARVSYILHA
jgi:RNA:NAD 2'-phosphotransferase (TPT1/KptA family)